MGRLIYSMNVSLDGFVNDANGSLDWSVPDASLHKLWNDEVAAADAEIYGRRLYEVMAAYWPTAESDPDGTPVTIEFARIWNSKPRVVFSRTLDSAEHASQVVSGDVGEELDGLKAEFSGDITVGGPTLATEFIRRDLVDAYRLAVHPVVLGGGLPYWPALDRPLPLRLVDRRELESGIVWLAYERVR